MKRILQKVLFMVAVITVTAHSIFPHIHLEDILAIARDHHHDLSTNTHHHEEKNNSKDNQHSLFSFAQLDETFVPANGQIKNFELPVEYIESLIVNYLADWFSVKTKIHFGWYKEYPPPGYYIYDLPSRAPPAVI